MKIQWHGHSCFSVEAEGYTVVFDPYEDNNVPGLAPLRLTADAVYCSHEHNDHNARDLVTLSGRDCALQIDTIPTFHDDALGEKRGKNTIHILSVDGMRIAHMGDLGHIPGPKHMMMLQGLDAMLIPVGGYYTIDAATAQEIVSLVSPRVVIPMHYRLGKMGYDVIGELSHFTKLFSNVNYYDTDTLVLTADTPAQTAVLKYVPR